MEEFDWLGNPISHATWAQLFCDERHVARDVVGHPEGGSITVSTVWMGINHNFSGDGPPLIFETMVFGGELSQDTWRWSTHKEAREGHAQVLAEVRRRIEAATA
jgi:hypothetical protein